MYSVWQITKGCLYSLRCTISPPHNTHHQFCDSHLIALFWLSLSCIATHTVRACHPMASYNEKWPWHRYTVIAAYCMPQPAFCLSDFFSIFPFLLPPNTPLAFSSSAHSLINCWIMQLSLGWQWQPPFPPHAAPPACSSRLTSSHLHTVSESSNKPWGPTGGGLREVTADFIKTRVSINLESKSHWERAVGGGVVKDRNIIVKSKEKIFYKRKLRLEKKRWRPLIFF